MNAIYIQRISAPLKSSLAWRQALKKPVIGARNMTLISARSTPKPSSNLFLYTALGAAGLSLAQAFKKPVLLCDTLPIRRDPVAPARSNVSLQSLGFGSAAGVCAGIFVAKGLRALAFLLGGAFVALQFLNSRSMAKVNWDRIQSTYDTTVNRLAGEGDVTARASSTLSRVYRNFSEFLMADFPQRATFMAGFVLGLRMG